MAGARENCAAGIALNMCRFERRALTVQWSLKKQQTSPQNHGAVAFPEATGAFVLFCTEHKCCCERVPMREYSTEERWKCPLRPDELSAEGKAEIQGEKE